MELVGAGAAAPPSRPRRTVRGLRAVRLAVITGSTPLGSSAMSPLKNAPVDALAPITAQDRSCGAFRGSGV
jgi:hypothetical protein